MTRSARNDSRPSYTLAVTIDVRVGAGRLSARFWKYKALASGGARKRTVEKPRVVSFRSSASGSKNVTHGSPTAAARSAGDGPRAASPAGAPGWANVNAISVDGGSADDSPEDRVDRGLGQIHRHAQPGEERRLVELHAAAVQAVPERFCLEVDRDVDEVLRCAHTRGREPLALDRLCRGLVHLEHAQGGCPRRLTIGERLEPRSEAHVLPNAEPDGFLQPIFGESRPEHYVRAQLAGPGRLEELVMFGDCFDRCADEPDDDGVVEDAWRRVNDLVRGIEPRHAHSGAARHAVSHSLGR